MKKTLLLLILALLMAVAPSMALATQVDVPEQGVALVFPSNVDVLTRGMDQNDPLLDLYGKTADEVSGELKSSGLYALAYDIAGNFTIKLSIKSKSALNYSEMSEQELKEIAGRFGGSKYELYSANQADFLLIYGDSGRALIALASKGGAQVELRLAAKGQVNAGMVKTIKDIARRTSLPQSQ